MNSKIDVLRIIADMIDPNLLQMKSIEDFENFTKEKTKKIHKEWKDYDEATCWMKKSSFYEQISINMAKCILKIRDTVQS